MADPPVRPCCVRGEAAGDHPDLAPLPGEPIIDKPARARFCATDLETDAALREHRNIVADRLTTDVCVHTTMREANDRGFEWC